MSEVWQPHPIANRGTHSNDSPMAFCLVGIRHHGSIPTSNLTAKIPGGQYRLLHKWVEAKALATITEKNVQRFVWRNIYVGMVYLKY